MRENRKHGSEGGNGESRFRPLSVRGKSDVRLNNATAEALVRPIRFFKALSMAIFHQGPTDRLRRLKIIAH